jgi:hypothetical protein
VLGKLSEFNSHFSVDTQALRISGNDVADKLAKEGAIEVSPNYTHQCRQKAHQEAFGTEASGQVCTGCRQSKMLMRYPLSRRANELQAMSKFRLRAVNRPQNPESLLAQTWTHRTARMPTVWIS